MSIAENLLNAAAREFIPTFAAPRNESTSDLAASRKPAEITSVTVNEDVCLDSRESVGKKKKTKDERSAPRKRRHQRGRSGDAAADYMLSSKSIKKQEKDLDDISYESLSWRESPSHHKSKSDGNILSWFDEIKQRRVSRYRKELDLYGDLPHDEAAQLNLVFSQPQEWVFGSNIADGKGLPSLEDTEYLAEKLERKKWQNWAQSAV